MTTVRKLKVSKKAIEMNDLLLSSNSFVIGDIETTTFSPEKGGRIIEIAGVKVENGKVIDTFSQLIDPQIKIPPKITELTGISNEMVQGQPVFGKVLPEFYQFLGDSIFVAHNAMFDWDRFLIYFFKKVGIIASNSTICSKVLAKLYFPYWKDHKLSTICSHENVIIDSHHRALDDSISLAKVVMKWKETEAKKYDSNGLFVPSEFVQQDLFGASEEEILVHEIKSLVDDQTPQPFKVKRVSYWEKDITKQKKMQRIYVLLSIGTVYFDIPAKAWYNKDVKSPVNFDEVSQRVLRYLKMGSQEELCFYRNAK